MEGERKYRQNGYQDSSSRDFSNGQQRRDERPKPQGPRPPLDVTGPRLPRMVQSVTAARCFNCSTTLLPDIDFKGKCPKCGAALHCCKQCSYFEPSTRFQCLSRCRCGSWGRIRPMSVRCSSRVSPWRAKRCIRRLRTAMDTPMGTPLPRPISPRLETRPMRERRSTAFLRRLSNP